MMDFDTSRPRPTRIPSRWLGSVGALLVMGGCANLIGLSDIENEDGKLLGGGSGGKGGTAGSGGSAGGGGFVGCDGTPFTPNADVVRSCVLRNSCNPLQPDFTISLCISYNLQNDLGAFACTKGADDCTDVEQCVGAGWVDQQTCDAGGGSIPGASGRCDGLRAINCDSTEQGLHYFRDCDVLGGTCDVMSDGTAACRVQDTCTGTASACGGPDGNHLYTCDAGEGFGFDCGAVDGTCDNRDGASCFYSATECATEGGACAGETIEWCSNGAERRWECGSVGLSCLVEGGSESYCLAPGCEPEDEANCVESCDGTSMTVCYGGVPVTLDCTEYGFNSCVLWEGDGTALPLEYVSCY